MPCPAAFFATGQHEEGSEPVVAMQAASADGLEQREITGQVVVLKHIAAGNWPLDRAFAGVFNPG